MDSQRFHIFIAGFAMIACLFFPVRSAPPVRPTLGFTVLEANGIDQYDATVYSQALRREVENTGVYRSIEFSDISIRLSEQGFSDRCTDAHCAIIAGQILGADFFGFGTIGKIGKTFTISMQVIEVRTGKIIRDISEFHKGKKSDFEQKVIPRFARELCGISQKK